MEIKELPYEPNLNKFLDPYVKYKFFDGTEIKTDQVAPGSTCKWMSKHVFLVGKMDQTQLKEQIR